MSLTTETIRANIKEAVEFAGPDGEITLARTAKFAILVFAGPRRIAIWAPPDIRPDGHDAGPIVRVANFNPKSLEFTLRQIGLHKLIIRRIGLRRRGLQLYGQSGEDPIMHIDIPATVYVEMNVGPGFDSDGILPPALLAIDELPPERVTTSDQEFVIALRSSAIVDQRRDSYKQFRDPDNPALRDYPLEGVTYPTDYGHLPGYHGEDGDDLDVFLGSDPTGENGRFRVSRPDIPTGQETKFYIGLSHKEMLNIIDVFRPVITYGPDSYDNPAVFRAHLAAHEFPPRFDPSKYNAIKR